MRIDHDAVVMVVDGRKLLLFRNKGDDAFPNLETETTRTQDNPPDRDQASDAPGRAFNSVGSHRSAMEQTNFHDLEEARFATEAADLLKRGALAKDYEKLIIVAPPRCWANCVNITTRKCRAAWPVRSPRICPITLCRRSSGSSWKTDPLSRACKKGRAVDRRRPFSVAPRGVPSGRRLGLSLGEAAAGDQRHRASAE